MLNARKWKDKMFNAPPQYFYPIPDSYLAPSIYDGTFNVPDASYSLHWFGGLPASQDFNKKYSRQYAGSSGDTISKFLREKQIL
jgi:hypothetical protein